MIIARRQIVSVAILCAALFPSGLLAHPGHEDDSDVVDGVRTWTEASGAFHFHGTMVSASGDRVQIRNEEGQIIDLPLSQFSNADQRWVQERALSKLNKSGRLPTWLLLSSCLVLVIAILWRISVIRSQTNRTLETAIAMSDEPWAQPVKLSAK